MLSSINSFSEFEKKVLKTPHPKLVLFYATWSDKSLKLVSTSESLLPIYEKYIEFFKIDIDKAPEIAEKYKLSSLPALMIVSEGQIEDFTLRFATREMVVGIMEGFFTRKGKKTIH
jgi:thioredoxin 1